MPKTVVCEGFAKNLNPKLGKSGSIYQHGFFYLVLKCVNIDYVPIINM